MDKKIRGFPQEHSEEKAHYFHLKSWDTVYASKEGGLGVKRMEDINFALIAKHAQQLASPTHRRWTKLIKAKYLRGKKILDVQRSQITFS